MKTNPQQVSNGKKKMIVRSINFGLLSGWIGSAVFATIIGTQLVVEFGFNMLAYATLFVGGGILSSILALVGGPCLALTVRWLSLNGVSRLYTSLFIGLTFGLVGAAILSLMLLIISNGKIYLEVHRTYTILISIITPCLVFWVSLKVSQNISS